MNDRLIQVVKKLSKILQAISLALIIGGIITVGALVAPTVFKTLPLEMAAPLMGKVFTKLGGLMHVSLFIFTTASVFNLICSVLARKNRQAQDIDALSIDQIHLGVIQKLLRAIKVVCSVAFISLGLLLVMEFIPIMSDYAASHQSGSLEKQQLTKAQFEELHKESRGLFQIEAGLGAVLLILFVL